MNTLFDNNLGVQAFRSAPIPGQALAYDKNDGACYWAANARNFAFNNVFAECDTPESFTLDYAPNRAPMPTLMLAPDGSRQTVDAATVSGGLVKNLEVHSHFGWGPWIKGGRFPADEPMRFEDTKVWDVHYSIDISGDNVAFDRVKVYNAAYGFYNLIPGRHLVRNAYCENVSPHGCFMTYRGGNGTMLYENLTAKNSQLVFRVDAINESGPSGKPIDVHARNVKLLNTQFNGPNGLAKVYWTGTEDANARSNPRTMLVLHDLFGANRDAVILPATQSPTLPGVPAGLNFVDGGSVTDARGVGFEGRGGTLVAEGNIPWPNSSLANPVDRLPPATTITYPANGSRPVASGGTLVVRGVSLDQFGVATVTVNGQAATISNNGFDWTATITGVAPGPLRISAEAVDLAGNRERTAHSIDIVVASGLTAAAGQRTILAPAPFPDQFAREAGKRAPLLPSQRDALVLTTYRGGAPVAPTLPVPMDMPPSTMICGRADAQG